MKDKNKPTEDQLKKWLIKMDLYEKTEVNTGNMEFERCNKVKAFYQSTLEANQRAEISPDQSKHFYRTMSKSEFQHLVNHNELPAQSSFGGIAPYYGYSAQTKYTGNKKDGSHIVEFRLKVDGRVLKEAIDEKAKFKIGKGFIPEGYKIESGCLSIGLGDTGLYGGRAKGVAKSVGLEVFNDWLRFGWITFRLVRFSLDI